MDEKYKKLLGMLSTHTNGDYMNIFKSYDNILGDDVCRDIFEIKEIEYHYIHVYITIDKELNINKGIKSSPYQPTNEENHYSIKIYSEIDFPKEQVDIMIDKLYQNEINSITQLELNLKNSKKDLNKIFKQRIRKEKMKKFL